MTTIAFRDGVVASDTQCTDSGLPTYKKKLYPVRDSVVAITGDVYACHKFLQWYSDKKQDKPDFPSDADFECLIFTPSGLYGVDAHMTMVRFEPGEYCAFGSGRDAALGAMFMGASAVEAIEAAIRFDVNTGGSIDRFTVRGL